MSSTQVNTNLQMLALEVFDTTEVPTAQTEGDRTTRISIANVNQVLNATSTPKVDKPPVYKKFTATGTLDLTAVQAAAIPSTATRTVDMTGAKVKGFTLKAPSTNAAAVNVAPGSANPYPLFGTGNDIDVKPGQRIDVVFSGIESSLPAVSGSVKNIDITIPTTETLEVLLILGT